nr:hypothetical transcript [Hymenolepis microstoma]
MDDTSPESEKKAFVLMLGNPKTMTANEMNNTIFQSAVDAAMKRLNDSNDCHNFKLETISEATSQVISGVKYTIKLHVKPIFDGADKEGCSRSQLFGSVEIQPVEVSVYFQPWISREPISVTFKPSDNLGSNGRFFNP